MGREQTSAHFSCGKQESLQVTQHPAEPICTSEPSPVIQLKQVPPAMLLFPKKAGCSFHRGASNHLSAAQTRHGVLCSSRALLDVHSSLFPQHWAVTDTIKLNSCSLQLFLSKIQRSFFFFPLEVRLWDFLNKYSPSSPEQNGSESKTTGFWICSVPLFFYETCSKSIMIGIKSKLEGTVLKPRKTFTFLRG